MPKATLSGCNVSRRMLSVSCFGLLLASAVVLTGCGMGNKPSVQEEKEIKVAPLELSVNSVEQLSKIGGEQADGQYLVVKAALKNMANQSMEIKPSDFILQNITPDDSERYSQPAEKGMTNPMGREYGAEIKDKVLDYQSLTLHPRLELERYFVFMVPSEARVDEYQITYINPTDTSQKISVPLASPEATINDHRSSIPTSEPIE